MCSDAGSQRAPHIRTWSPHACNHACRHAIPKGDRHAGRPCAAAKMWFGLTLLGLHVFPSVLDAVNAAIRVAAATLDPPAGLTLSTSARFISPNSPLDAICLTRLPS